MSGLPASSNRSVVLPVAVSISDAADLGADGGRAGRDGDDGVGHRVVEVDLQPLPDGRLQALDTHAVAGSPSIAAAGDVAGATSGIAVESDDELDTVIRPPVHAP